MYRQGHISLWDPYIFAGLPRGAEIQTGLFYPLNVISAMLPVFKAIAHFVAIHLFLASLFMYLYLRGSGLSRLPSVFGSLVFAYSGFSIVHTEQLSIISTCAWLPLILLLMDRASERRGVVYPVLAGIVVGLQFLAGHPQMALINGLVIGAYAVFILYKPSRLKDWAQMKRRAIIIIYILALGLSLASIAFIPFLEVYPYSLRADTGLDTSKELALTPSRLHTLLMPELRPNKEELDEVTGSSYVGIVPLILAVLAASMRRRGLVRFYTLIGFLSLLVSMGRATPLYYLLSLFAPFRPALQLPLRFLFPYMLAISVLSALGLQHLQEMRSGILSSGRLFGLIIAVLIFCLVLFFSIAGSRDFLLHSTAGGLRAPIVFVLIFGACAILLRIWARGMKPEVFNFFEHDRSLYRVSIFDRDIGLNLPMVYAIQNISGYNAIILKDVLHYFIYNATHSHDLSMVQSASRFYLLPNLDTKMSALMNVKYHVAPFTKDGKRQMGVSLRKNFYPRAFLVPQCAVVTDRTKILEILGDEEFDPTASILLETGSGLENFRFSPATRGDARVAHFAPDHIEIVTRADGDSFLFLSEIFFPGWKVYVDGVEGAIYRGNYLFRSVPLRAGGHRVSFIYDPLSFRAGKYISIAAVGLCILFLAWGFRSESWR
ncbi:MAG: YfhO family protein [Candidatus Aureabacteria bacterium]|nr:YfhO family protein [Candidatus Auribacterota bacterium]